MINRAEAGAVLHCRRSLKGPDTGVINLRQDAETDGFFTAHRGVNHAAKVEQTRASSA
ncbi:MAG: hypothetical protein AAF918_12940 [Pseudomonadota bacterium]